MKDAMWGAREMKTALFSVLTFCSCSVLLSGCATAVPEMSSFPYTSKHELAKEGDLAVHIKCEMRQALNSIFREERLNNVVPDSPESASWLKKWGATVSVKLQVIELGQLAPSVAYGRPLRNILGIFSNGGNVTTAQSYTDAAGLTLSSQATRTETIDFFYRFSDLIDDADVQADSEREQPCDSPSSPFLQGNLKIGEFLKTEVLIARVPGIIERAPKSSSSDNKATTFIVRGKIERDDDGSDSLTMIVPNTGNSSDPSPGPTLAGGGVGSGTDTASLADPYSTLNYEVIFAVVRSGAVSPSWKLFPLSVNTGMTPFLSGSRTRTDDLTITMGPIVNGDLNAPASAQRQAALIGQQVRN